MLNLQSLFRNRILMSSKNPIYVIGLVLLFQSYLFSTTYYVDGSVAGGNCTQADPCERIQTAIDLATTDGDIVIVAGGMIYEENLLIETGITLKSESSTNPATIDGSNTDGGSNGSCIIIRSASGSTTGITPTVQDMIITGGTGTLVNEDVDHDGNYNGTMDVQIKVGGGILVHNASLTSRRNNIKNNGSSGTKEGGAVYVAGSGIDIEDDNPNIPPPPVFNTRSTIIFDATVFEDNTAQTGHTIMVNAWDPEPGRSIDITFPSSTFDVAFDSDDNLEDGVSEYWVSGKDDPVFDFSGDITGRYQAVVSQNVWVNPVDGVDEGYISGSFDEPFQTINYAMGMIYPTETNPITINLTEGTFSPGSNGESFPIVFNSHIILNGQGEDVTILNAEADSENNTSVIQQGWDNYGMSISNLTISGGEDFFGGGINFSHGDLNLTNIIIRDNIAYMNGGGINFSHGGDLLLSNVKIMGNDAQASGGGIYIAYGGSIITESGTGYVVISGNHALLGGGIYIMMGLLSNMQITENLAVEGGGIYFESNATLINMTIANNSAESTGNGVMCDFCDPLKVVNSILRNGNNGNLSHGSAVAEDNITAVFNSNIQGGMDDSWGGDFNISSDPLFVNEDSGGYYLSSNSPCIDSGTNDINDIILWENLSGDSWYTIGDGIPDISDYFGDAPDMGAFEWGLDEPVLIGCQNELGDVNMDEVINILDIVLMVDAILGNGTEFNDCMDMDGNGTVNILDIVRLVEIILNS